MCKTCFGCITRSIIKWLSYRRARRREVYQWIAVPRPLVAQFRALIWEGFLSASEKVKELPIHIYSFALTAFWDPGQICLLHGLAGYPQLRLRAAGFSVSMGISWCGTTIGLTLHVLQLLSTQMHMYLFQARTWSIPPAQPTESGLVVHCRQISTPSIPVF